MMSKGCQQFCYADILLDEIMVVTDKSEKYSYLFSILGGFISLIATVLEGSALMPVVLRT